MTLVTIQFRRGSAAAWTSANPVLHLGEPGLDTTSMRLKLGDGVTAWEDLEWTTPTPAQMAELIELLENFTNLDDERMTDVVGDIDSDFYAALLSIIGTQVPTASTTAQGKVELATNTEAAAGADTVRALTPGGLRYALANGQVADDLTATIGAIKAWAKNPDQLVVGALTYTLGVLTSAAVVWPDGATGTMTITSRQASTGAVTGYTITRVTGAGTQTYTQPTITRDSSGNATVVPQITVA